MNATNHNGVHFQTISDNHTVIVDCNRNQIIERYNGKPKVYRFKYTPDLLAIKTIIDHARSRVRPIIPS